VTVRRTRERPGNGPAAPSARQTGSGHAGAVINAFTVDVEDWYQGLEIGPDHWGNLEDRLAIGTRRLLALLEEAGVHATFFVLGTAAEEHPDLIREISDAGHEIATHGYGHQFVYHLGAEGFRSDLRHSMEILEGIVGAAVQGYRAPYFSITEQSPWAFDVLAECGIRFDSSVFPVRNYRYGMPNAPRWMHRVRDDLVECPLSTWRLMGHNVPIAGGAYFRIFPYTFTRSGLRRLNAHGCPAVFYIHPWELDPEHPRLRLPCRIAVPHYWNLRATEARLRRLLRDFQFGPMGECVGRAFSGEGAPASDARG